MPTGNARQILRLLFVQSVQSSHQRHLNAYVKKQHIVNAGNANHQCTCIEGQGTLATSMKLCITGVRVESAVLLSVSSEGSIGFCCVIDALADKRPSRGIRHS